MEQEREKTASLVNAQGWLTAIGKAMTKTLYEIGKAGLHQFIDALAEVISEDMTLTQEQAGGVPLSLADAEKKLLAAWDEICGIRGRKGNVKE
ncbi:MAG: hypothetical protein KAJ19_24395 [Gammaproteobacteria bacterium]|nr:hypothetical protein [Gammaproteobacteria bacterium]